MIGLGALTQSSFLRLDEIADMRIFANLAAWPQMGKRPYLRAALDNRIRNHATLAYKYIIGNSRVLNHGAGANQAIRADARMAQQLDIRLDHSIRTNLDIGIDHTGLGAKDGNALHHKPVC